MAFFDELASWLGSFERYSGGASQRGFYLTAWNGGSYLKDRVGKGASDPDAELRVENLGLTILGAIQPDRLGKLTDLTDDGLLQRFLVVLMNTAERGDEMITVQQEKADYDALITAVCNMQPTTFAFDPAAEPVRKRALDRLYELGRADGISNALRGAIGKMPGYFGRLALVLHVAEAYSATVHDQGKQQAFTAPTLVSPATAEAVETLMFQFLLPHIFGLYDGIDGGRDRDTLQAIGDFILAFPQKIPDRIRPSDFLSGVRKLRGLPANKVAEWASRFTAFGWIRPEDERPIPRGWIIEQGLREHFAKRAEDAKRSRAAAHAILKAGGTRPKTGARS
jgi:hypothetical protein